MFYVKYNTIVVCTTDYETTEIIKQNTNNKIVTYSFSFFFFLNLFHYQYVLKRIKHYKTQENKIKKVIYLHGYGS